MTATFFLAGQEMQQPDVRANADGTVSIGLNAGFWVTVTSRRDCADLMKAAADADSLFIRQKAAAEARQVIAGQLAPAGDMAALAHEARPLVPLPERDPDGMPLGWAALHEELGDAEHAAGLAPNPVPALLLDPDCRDGKHPSCVGGPCMCGCHEPAYAVVLIEPDPPQPAFFDERDLATIGMYEPEPEPLPGLPERDPGHALGALHAGAVAKRMERELNPEALAKVKPLETLAADPEDTP